MMKVKSTLPKITFQAMMEECELIYEFPDDTSLVVMGDFLQDEYEDIIRNGFIEENDTKVKNEVKDISIETANEDVNTQIIY